jgi:predicted Zn-ribbon and HTH transcriptional regulator
MTKQELSNKVERMIATGNLVEQNGNVLSNWIKQLKEPPRCASCGATEHLTAGYAVNEVSYCPVCRRDEEQR